LASIGLQGIRLAQPTLGEAFVVTGAGLIGLLTIQLLIAHGCRVLAIDFDQSKLDLANEFGAEVCNPSKGEDPVSAGIAFSRGRGVDGVIITASTKASDPVTQAARMSRKRGRIVLVGVVGLELNRADFYEKELSFQVSCSYGPGRYDSDYEDKGIDYPVGFVRWTEKRNFEAVLDLMASGLIDVKPLITHRFAFERAPEAYELLTQGGSSLGIILQYTSDSDSRRKSKVLLNERVSVGGGKPVVGLIGAGNYASRILIPAFVAANAELHTVVTSGGINGVIHGKKAGFGEASTSVESVLDNPAINVVTIATRHGSHSDFVVKALNARKHVFVEKPLAISHEQLSEIVNAYRGASESEMGSLLMVGFNRRFSPHVQKMKSLLAAVSEPKTFIMTINAGSIPEDHWTQDPDVGGGRIIGEACHFVDLMRFLAGCKICSVQVRGMGRNDRLKTVEDKATLLLGFSDGSFGTIHYLANGAKSFPKERIEVFCAERVLQIDNFRKMKGYNWPGFTRMNLWRQDKGQNSCVKAFLDAISKGGTSPIPFDELLEVARTTIDAADMIRQQQ
jgi:predicted dehydrogenase